MNYKEFKKNLSNLEKKYKQEKSALYDEIKMIALRLERKKISDEEAKRETDRLYDILDKANGREKRSVEKLKMNFARQDAPAKIGDIIWASTKQGTKLLKVTEIKLAAFEYPMLKYFGIQMKVLTGLPQTTQKQYPNGGIYQKDITSVNGEAYKYKVRE